MRDIIYFKENKKGAKKEMKKELIIGILILGLLATTVSTALPASPEKSADLQLINPGDPHPLNLTGILGYVSDETGQQIEGAKVVMFCIWYWQIFKIKIPVLNVWRGFTHPEFEGGEYPGFYHNGGARPGLNYTIRVSKLGYLPVTKKVFFSPEHECLGVDFTLKKIF